MGGGGDDGRRVNTKTEDCEKKSKRWKRDEEKYEEGWGKNDDKEKEMYGKEVG